MLTLKKLNRELKTKFNYIELVRGRDYFYLQYDTGLIFETRSIYVAHLNQFTKQQWIDEAQEFYLLMTAPVESII